VGPGGGSWSHEARDDSGATLCQETGAVGHADMCNRLVFRLDLELVHGGIRSSEYRQCRRRRANGCCGHEQKDILVRVMRRRLVVL
jgi:hypothetical protein